MALGSVSKFVEVRKSEAGATCITLRYERYGLKGIAGSLLLLGIFIGCPLWFYIANQAMIPGWFLAIPGVFLFFALFAVFIQSRRYTMECHPERISVTVRYWFPPFQWIFGKRVSIPAPALKAVRVNRYDGGNYHLEIGVDKYIKLPRLAGAAFNTGALRMLPRSVSQDDLKTVGLWTVYPLDKKVNGPRINDLYVLEELVQKTYALDSLTG